MKNTAVTEFLFALATLAISATLFIGCGGDPACENGTCDQGPDDAGTSGDGNPITGEDGGTDGGDVTTGDGGSDTGITDPCKGYEWFNDDFICQGSSITKTCETWAEADVCYAKCTDLFNRLSVNDAKLTLTAPNKLDYDFGAGFKGSCSKQ